MNDNEALADLQEAKARAEAAERRLQALQQAVGKWQRRCDRGYDPEEEPTTTEYWLGVRAVVDELASFTQPGAKLEGPASGAPAAATMSATESTGILALIKKWRADADFNLRETSPGYSHGLRKCADELLATLTQPGAAGQE